MQTKKQSLIEIIISTAIGFVVSLISTFVLFPIVGINSTSSKNVVITIFFTVISIARGYFVRRIFNNFK
ncbi:DUF7220 family protein [Tenacibaculum soleae]